MKVSELMDILGEADQDLPVYIYIGDKIWEGYVEANVDDFHFNKTLNRLEIS